MNTEKWICSYCGSETETAPKNRSTFCIVCKRGRMQHWKMCECGKWFKCLNSHQKYCSKGCGYEFGKKGGKKGKHYPSSQKARIAVCLNCGKEFRATEDYKNRKAVYCSWDCFVKGRSEPRICPQCGTEFRTTKARDKKFCSSECRNLAYRLNKGELSHFWKGGKTKETDLIKSSAEYRYWRDEVFRRDDYRCQICGVRGGQLEAHHIKEKCNFPELMFDVNNGVTLCHTCHKTTDNYGRKAADIHDRP